VHANLVINSVTDSTFTNAMTIQIVKTQWRCKFLSHIDEH